MNSGAIGLFRRAVMQGSTEPSGSESPVQAAAPTGPRRESFPFLAERIGAHGEVPRQAALERWRKTG